MRQRRVELRGFRRAVVILTTGLFLACGSGDGSVGRFQGAQDIGDVKHAGSTEQLGTDRYRLTGSGANIWDTRDAFHFAWTQMEGDLLLQADVEWEGEGGNPHRKAGLMIRDSLEANAPYVDAMVHGDGLISLQFRRVVGGETAEVRAHAKAPALLRLERTGDVFSLFVRPEGAEHFETVGNIRVELHAKPYVGLALSSHEADRVESALFDEMTFSQRVLESEEERVLESSLEIVEVETGRRRVVYRTLEHFEAPNWSPDGSYLLFNQDGRLYTLPVEGGIPEELPTGFATHCNNDHGFSPDGEWLAISHAPEGESLIYIVPSRGGEPRLVTEKGPSYWHGWSPDGRELAYCAERNGEYDLYTIPVEGGEETRLTTAEGLDDGPDYTPDGAFIYFNSERTGLMKIWRITPDGGGEEQVTFDEDHADWFPHPSPDGRSMVFLSYHPDVEGHPPNQEVTLRRMSLDGGDPEILAYLFGGQGTINVPSWSPDSREVAFVSYRLVAPQ